LFGQRDLFWGVYSQNGNELPVQTVECNIPTVTEIDDPVSELVLNIFDRPPDTWLMFQHFAPLANRAHGTVSRVRTCWRRTDPTKS